MKNTLGLIKNSVHYGSKLNGIYHTQNKYYQKLSSAGNLLIIMEIAIGYTYLEVEQASFDFYSGFKEYLMQTVVYRHSEQRY